MSASISHVTTLPTSGRALLLISRCMSLTGVKATAKQLFPLDLDFSPSSFGFLSAVKKSSASVIHYVGTVSP